MHVIGINKCLTYCQDCRRIEKEQVEVSQKIALFFDAGTLDKRKLHGFNGVGVMGTVKSVQKDENKEIYSVKLENGALSEIIVSSIKEIVLLCDDCAKKYNAQNEEQR